MKKLKQGTRGQLLLSMIINPIFIIVYWVSFYELYTLCKYGRIYNNIKILFICMLFYLGWFTFLIIRIMKSKTQDKIKINEDISFEPIEKYNSSYKGLYNYAAFAILIIITLFYGVKIYQSAINFNGKLAWHLRDVENKRTVTFEHNNIYESGIEGILKDINKKIQMPKDLYVSSSFSVNFDSNGLITSFDTFLYGKNDKGKLESFLITYDCNKSKNITIILNGYVNGEYNKDKLLEPLLSTMKVIPLKKTVSNWNEKEYGILYYGKRSFGYNTNGIVYINQQGNTKQASSPSSEIIGYAVSVFVPGKENAYTPVRYIFAKDLNNIKPSEPLKVNKKTSSKSNNGIDEYYLSDKIGYRLEVTDAAAGSRAYSLNGTVDGGTTWNVVNKDPFQGRIGVAAGITFLNEKLGFLCLSHSGGTEGDLYRTEDGGLTYKKVDFQGIKVTLSNGESYEPFHLPGMPYKADGKLNMLIGQGANGDYNGGSKALYESKDEGQTWQYIKEVPRQ